MESVQESTTNNQEPTTNKNINMNMIAFMQYNLGLPPTQDAIVTTRMMNPKF